MADCGFLLGRSGYIRDTVGQEVDAKIIAFDPAAKKMNLSIKACLAEPERKTSDKSEGEESKEGKKHARAPRKEEDELSSWSDGSSVGTSLGDLLANAEKKNK